MKRLSQYFYGGCIAYTVINIIVIIMHLVNRQETVSVNTQISLLFILLLIQGALYLMENLQIKSQVLHIVTEFLLVVIITFAVGIPAKVIRIDGFYDAVQIVLIIAATHAITVSSLYKGSISAAADINRQLQKRQ